MSADIKLHDHVRYGIVIFLLFLDRPAIVLIFFGPKDCSPAFFIHQLQMKTVMSFVFTNRLKLSGTRAGSSNRKMSTADNSISDVVRPIVTDIVYVGLLCLPCVAPVPDWYINTSCIHVRLSNIVCLTTECQLWFTWIHMVGYEEPARCRSVQLRQRPCTLPTS